MSTKHTPGPWEISAKYGRRSDGSIAIMTKTPEGEKIPVAYANLTADVPAKVRQEMSCDEESEANARLIAAAPELLYTIRAAKRWLETMLDFPEHRPAAHTMINAIDAAIAKAEGKS